MSDEIDNKTFKGVFEVFNELLQVATSKQNVTVSITRNTDEKYFYYNIQWNWCNKKYEDGILIYYNDPGEFVKDDLLKEIKGILEMIDYLQSQI